jgi:hypothetical protein
MNFQPVEILRNFGGVHLALPIQKVNEMRQYIGADVFIPELLLAVEKGKPL